MFWDNVPVFQCERTERCPSLRVSGSDDGKMDGVYKELVGEGDTRYRKTDGRRRKTRRNRKKNRMTVNWLPGHDGFVLVNGMEIIVRSRGGTVLYCAVLCCTVLYCIVQVTAVTAFPGRSPGQD